MDNYQPNRALRFLRWFCRVDFLDEIEGDIIELYELRSEKSQEMANRMLWWDVMRSFRWINIKKVNTQNNQLAMFSNYFKVGFRNLRRDYRFSIINLVGLSLGLSVFLIMIMMVRHEYSFDTFHAKADRTFQVIQEFRQSDGADPEIWTPTPLAEALVNDVANVEDAIYLQGSAANWVEVGGKRFFEADGMMVGANFFDIFDFKLTAGDPSTVLKTPRSTVISESLSQKYFGYENPIGKVIEHEFYGPFTVTGVMEDVPGNSYLQFEFILTQDMETYFENVASWYEPWFKSWEGHGVSTFVVLKEGASTNEVEQVISSTVKKNLKVEEVNRFYLLGLLDLHFGSHGIDGRINQHIKGDLAKVKLFGMIATIIMLMACFNYVNITTARAIKRHKEVGIRKSIGAFRSQVMSQFLIESLILVNFAIGCSLILSYYLVPVFNEITGINLVLNTALLVDIIPWILLLVILVTLVSGFYPAFVLSGVSPLTLVNKMIGSGLRVDLLRNGLVTIQFATVLIIAACLVIIHDQYEYMSKKSLGLRTEEIVVVEINSGSVRSNYQTIKSELTSSSTIKEVTGITRVFSGYRSPVSIVAHHDEDQETKYSLKFYGLDHDAPEVFGLQFLAGEGFSGIENIDSTSVILNEKAAAQFGGLEALGKWISMNEDQGDHQGGLKAKVIGIVRDFHFESLHQPIKPIALGYYKTQLESLDDIIIKIDGNRLQEALAHIEAVHNRYDTNDIMDWEFLDDMTQRAYEDEVIFRNVMTAASVISLVVALLGMIGMISYNMIARTKEFGIRKVLGASLLQLFMVQGYLFTRFIVISSLIATPLAWWVSSNWLDSYAFRISLTPSPFLLVIAFLAIMTALTIFVLGRNTFKQNPTKSLRYE